MQVGQLLGRGGRGGKEELQPRGELLKKEGGGRRVLVA